MNKIWIVGAAIIAMIMLLFGVAGGIIIDRQILNASAQPVQGGSSTNPDFSLIEEATNIIQERYVRRADITQNELTYGAISGMVDALGDTGHSRFMTPEMIKAEQDYNAGAFEGVGLEVRVKDGFITIVAPIDNSPAMDAGIQAGEIIIGVNGEEVTGQPLSTVISKILGPAGTQVTLTILDPKTNQSRDVVLTRARIEVQNVTWTRIPGTDYAHIRLSAFSQDVSKDLNKALKEIQDQGLKGVVLDLRNNGGGLLDEAINVSSQFIDSGLVMKSRDAQGKLKDYPAKRGGAAINIPLVVLINQGSASAAEITAGAFQDNGRALLVGQTTFGTGTVLNQFGLQDGSAILLATSEWLTPKERVIWHQGIAPDIAVELPDSGLMVFPNEERSMTPEQFQAITDNQLLTAIQVLRDPASVPTTVPATPTP